MTLVPGPPQPRGAGLWRGARVVRRSGAFQDARPRQGEPRPQGRSAPAGRLPRPRLAHGAARSRGRRGGRRVGASGPGHVLGPRPTGPRRGGEPGRPGGAGVPRAVRGGPRRRDPDREADPGDRGPGRRLVRRRGGAADPRPGVPDPGPARPRRGRALGGLRRAVLPGDGPGLGSRARRGALGRRGPGAGSRAPLSGRPGARDPRGRGVRVARRGPRRRRASPAPPRQGLPSVVAGE